MQYSQIYPQLSIHHRHLFFLTFIEPPYRHHLGKGFYIPLIDRECKNNTIKAEASNPVTDL
jgi:hypothetical protein